jgi:hypothetical protein
MDAIEARRLLGVEATTSPTELRAAYHGMLKRWHPDRFGPDTVSYPEAVRNTQRINSAYQLLVAEAGTQALHRNRIEAPSPSDWNGRPIATVSWKWWPIRTLASPRTPLPIGTLIFVLMWAVLVGLGVAIETVLQ